MDAALGAIDNHPRAGFDQMPIDCLAGFIHVMNGLAENVADRVLIFFRANNDPLAGLVSRHRAPSARRLGGGCGGGLCKNQRRDQCARDA